MNFEHIPTPKAEEKEENPIVQETLNSRQEAIEKYQSNKNAHMEKVMKAKADAEPSMLTKFLRKIKQYQAVGKSNDSTTSIA